MNPATGAVTAMKNLGKSVGKVPGQAVRTGAAAVNTAGGAVNTAGSAIQRYGAPGRAVNRQIANVGGRVWNRLSGGGGVRGVVDNAMAGNLPGQRLATMAAPVAIPAAMTAQNFIQGQSQMAGQMQGRGVLQQQPGPKLAEQTLEEDQDMSRKQKIAAQVHAMRERQEQEKTAGIVAPILGTLATQAIGMAAHTALKSQHHAERNRAAEQVWNRMRRHNPELTQGPEAREQFDLLMQRSPTLASNYLSARSAMVRMSRTGGVIPHEFIASLGDTEKKIGDTGTIYDMAAQRIGSITSGNLFDGVGSDSVSEKPAAGRAGNSERLERISKKIGAKRKPGSFNPNNREHVEAMNEVNRMLRKKGEQIELDPVEDLELFMKEASQNEDLSELAMDEMIKLAMDGTPVSDRTPGLGDEDEDEMSIDDRIKLLGF